MSAPLAHLGDPATHFWLTRSMARTMGVSFSEAMACGALSAAEYASMVTQCRKCPNVEACQTWLGAQDGSAKKAPAFCCHVRRLHELTETV